MRDSGQSSAEEHASKDGLKEGDTAPRAERGAASRVASWSEQRRHMAQELRCAALTQPHRVAHGMTDACLVAAISRRGFTVITQQIVPYVSVPVPAGVASTRHFAMAGVLPVETAHTTAVPSAATERSAMPTFGSTSGAQAKLFSLVLCALTHTAGAVTRATSGGTAAVS